MNDNTTKTLELSVILGIDVPHYRERFQRGWSTNSETRANIAYVFRHYVQEGVLEKSGLSVDEAVDAVWESFTGGRMLRLRDAVYDELDRYYDSLCPEGEAPPFLKNFRRVARTVAVSIGYDSHERRCELIQNKLEQRMAESGEKLPPDDYANRISDCLTRALKDVEAFESDAAPLDEDVDAILEAAWQQAEEVEHG